MKPRLNVMKTFWTFCLKSKYKTSIFKSDQSLIAGKWENENSFVINFLLIFHIIRNFGNYWVQFRNRWNCRKHFWIAETSIDSHYIILFVSLEISITTESSSGTGKIVGSIVGALVMLAFVISVSYFCKRSKLFVISNERFLKRIHFLKR